MNSLNPRPLALLVVACGAGVLLAPGVLAAGEKPAVRLEKLLPDDVIAYARFAGLTRKVEAFLRSDLRQKIASSPAVKEILEDRELRDGLQLIRELEAKSGLDFADLLGEVFGRDVAVGLFLDFSGVQGVLLARFAGGEEARTMAKRLRAAAADATGKPLRSTLAEYEGETIEAFESVSCAVIGDVLAIASQTGVLESVIDLAAGRSTDSVFDSEAYGPVVESQGPFRLALRPNFLPAVRVPEKLDWLSSLLFGGWLEAIHASRLLTVDLELDPSSLVLRGASLVGARGPGEEYAPWFPSDAAASIAEKLRDDRALAVVEVHRDLAAWWRNRSHIVDARALPKMESFAQYMSVVFGGSSFERDVLSEMSPPITLVARRRRYPGATPQPAIPEFAAIVPLRSPERFGETALAAVQRLVGIARVEQLRRPGDRRVELTLTTRECGGRALHCVELRSGDQAVAGLIDNFSPCLAIVNARAVLSSTTALAEALIGDLGTLPAHPDTSGGATTPVAPPLTDSLWLDCVELLRALGDNPEILGRGTGEASGDGSLRAVAPFLELFKHLRLTSVREGDLIRVSLELSTEG